MPQKSHEKIRSLKKYVREVFFPNLERNWFPVVIVNADIVVVVNVVVVVVDVVGAILKLAAGQPKTLIVTIFGGFPPF